MQSEKEEDPSERLLYLPANETNTVPKPLNPPGAILFGIKNIVIANPIKAPPTAIIIRFLITCFIPIDPLPSINLVTQK